MTDIINTKEYVPFSEAVNIYGKTDSAFVYQVNMGRIEFIEVWGNHKLYKVKDILTILNKK